MTMELDMKSFAGFEELSDEELYAVNGGLTPYQWADVLGRVAGVFVDCALGALAGPFVPLGVAISIVSEFAIAPHVSDWVSNTIKSWL
jgi:hypothetical protein